MDINKIKILNASISKAWDNNVLTRAQDLEKGSDYSYTKIITPWVSTTALRHTETQSRILDIGCGCGYLTNIIYEQNRHNIMGIDLSPVSISYAKERYPKIRFVCQDIYSAALKQEYDMCLAIMLLNNVPNVEILLKNMVKVLKRHGKVILVLPHPVFWPQKHLGKAKYFSYEKEGSYQFQFSTKGRKDYSTQVTYFHRSVKQYISTIYKVGFNVLYGKEIIEMDRDITPDIWGLILQKE